MEEDSHVGFDVIGTGAELKNPKDVTKDETSKVSRGWVDMGGM
jgi:hypothetical protein